MKSLGYLSALRSQNRVGASPDIDPGSVGLHRGRGLRLGALLRHGGECFDLPGEKPPREPTGGVVCVCVVCRVCSFFLSGGGVFEEFFFFFWGGECCFFVVTGFFRFSSSFFSLFSGTP